MAKQGIISILLCAGLLHAHPLSSQEMNQSPDDGKVMLVIDEELDYQGQLPKKFRTTKEPFEKVRQPMPSRDGLAELLLAGSAQFSPRTLQNALKLLENHKIWIVDLRRETHGFVDEVSISWFANQNQSNLGLSTENIVKQEEMLLGDIERQSVLMVNQILDKEGGAIQKTKRYIIDVENVRNEAKLASELDAGYFRLAVRDHNHPDDEAVDQFLNFLKELPEKATLYFHCRGGKGRTTLFMSMVDMLHNAKKVSLNDIIARQALIGGSDLFAPEEDTWKKETDQARKDFISAFYKYAKDAKGYPKQSWSEWKKHHPIKN